jgi:hypothetical protein
VSEGEGQDIRSYAVSRPIQKDAKRPAAGSEGEIPILHVEKGASLKTLYAVARRAFTADDLQKFTEVEDGVPAEELLRELESLGE